MNSKRRPIAVLLVSCLYLAVGIVGFVVNFTRLITLQPDALGMEITELLAVIAGVWMFRGRNWARWLALVWMAFHVAISFPVLREVLTHSVIFALIAWALFRPESRRYFTPPKTHVE
jgi:hypothetical protein